MKKLLLIAFVTLSLGSAQAQFISIDHYAVEGIPICEGMIQIYGSMQFPPGDPTEFTITVDWADGTTTDSTFMSPGFGGFYIGLTHPYALAGNYEASYTVYSAYLGANAVEDVPFDLLIGATNACGYVTYVFIYQDVPSIDYYDVPLDFQGSDGSTVTIMPSSYLDSTILAVYSGLNPNLAPYTVSVSDDWLADNGLIQVTADQIITGFELFGQAIVASGELIFEVACVTAILDPDVVINYGWAWSFIAPLETGNLSLTFCNHACQNTTDATVTVQFPGGFTPNTSSLAGASFSAGVLTFDLDDLDDCETVSIPCTFPGTTPAGTQVCFPVSISAPNDTDLSNNLDTICGIVLNSYDPNDKQVNQPAAINPDTQETFLYQIRFQNDGNFPAVNVVIRDTLSENLDLSTFRFLEASHSVAASLNPTTREVTFTFNAIWLESSDVDLEASQGFIRYEIKEATGLVEGDAIENTAYIYFDFNPPIVTNTTVNTNAYPLSLNKHNETQIDMYPNPSSGNLKFSGGQIQNVVIYDLLGQVVLRTHVVNNMISLDGLNTGVYFVEMHSGNELFTKRLVVSR